MLNDINNDIGLNDTNDEPKNQDAVRKNADDKALARRKIEDLKDRKYMDDLLNEDDYWEI